MPVQRTFTLIQPVSGPSGGEAFRPMTSKQVRKAYREANRAPRLSRAERIRQEKAEQERIRKEHERDKAAARARAAREKKQDEQQAERERKKKAGLPLVSVRPSQDTIARFVRGNGTGRKRDAAGERTPEGAAEAARQPSEEAPKAHPSPGGRREELDLIPEVDELELEMMKQLDATTAHDNEQHEMEPQKEASKQPAAEHNPRSRSAEATSYELDLGLRASIPRPSLRRQRGTAGPSECGPPADPAKPARQPPPPSTQAILHNLNDFFPSSSQQERELQDEKTADAPLAGCAKQHEQPAPMQQGRRGQVTGPSPSRFFTSSGSSELVHLAMQRSRRSAALEEIHRKERRRPGAPEHAEPPGGAPRRARRLRWTTGAAPKQPAAEKMAEASDANKENVAPPRADGIGAAPSASQETEYGGEWVDEIALELAI